METQPTFSFDDVEQHDRTTTFFRLILAIPVLIWAAIRGLVAQFGVVIAWFAIAFTGRYPAGIYAFVGRNQRYQAAVAGYTGLLTDTYPGFHTPTADAPVRLTIPDAKERYSRPKAIFRLIVGLPVILIAWAFSNVSGIGGLLQWVAIVFTGRRSVEFQSLVELGLSYQQRSNVYLALMSEDWPPIRDPRVSWPASPERHTRSTPT